MILPIPFSKNATSLINGKKTYFYISKNPPDMSQAFVKESDEEWLHEVLPTIAALIQYLTRQNNGVRVYQKSNKFSERHGREIHLMSNGFTYARDDAGKWYIAE